MPREYKRAEPRTALARRLQIAAERLDLKNTEIADHLGISPQGVTKWLSGERSPRLESLQRLAEVLQVPVSELLGEGTA